MRPLFIGVIALSLFGGACSVEYPSPVPTTYDQYDVSTEEVATGTLRGIYYHPTRPGKAPGILVIHEWWGLNAHIKEQARKLAGQGYAVFAIDLYNGDFTTDPKRAGELAGAVRANPDAAKQQMAAALDYLAADWTVAGDKLATLGWCFGGGMSALVGASGDPRIKATVIYYGNPITDAAQLSRMKQPVLGIWGEADKAIPVADVKTFESALKAQQTPVEFHYYADAGHAFANPSRSDSYRPEDAADAWEKTLTFLLAHLNK